MAEQDVKFDQLVAFLTQTQKQSPSKFIVYFSTCACANYFGQQMKLLIDLPNFPILILHGKIAPKVVHPFGLSMRLASTPFNLAERCASFFLTSLHNVGSHDNV